MSPEQLLKHFEKIAEAPDAIPRLRRFILDLAVRGKLVEQDANDEPASKILARIAHAKCKSLKNKKNGLHSPLFASEGQAQVPLGWQSVQFQDILLTLQTGPFGSSLHQQDYELGGTPVVNPASIQNGRIIPIDKMAVGPKVIERLSSFKLRPGNVVMGRRGEMGRCAVVTENEAGWLCGTGSLILGFTEDISPWFIVKLMSAPCIREYLGGASVGATMQNLNQSILCEMPVGLPPLAEQRRIVAKVDELMALCDELEVARAKQESRRDRLVAATLHALNNCDAIPDSDATPSFQERARFYFNHLPRLATRPDHIKQLSQTILNLAVRGKLVPQDPRDEPVVNLLERINREQCDLVKAGRLKSRVISGNPEAANYFQDIPKSWRCARLADLIEFGPQNGISPPQTNNDKAPKALTLSATTTGYFNPAYYKFVELGEATCEGYWLSTGDVLFQRGNTREYVGMAAVFNGPERTYVFPDLMIRVRFSGSLSLRYVHMVLISPPLRGYFSSGATGASSTMPKISQGILLNAPIPLPPLPEQHRIVVKVDELMSLCDELENRLTTSDTTRRQLLESTLHEALEL